MADFFDNVSVRGTFKTPGNNQFCELFNSTRLEVDYTLGTSVSTGTWRGMFKGGKVQGHVLASGNNGELRFYFLSSDGTWDTTPDKPADPITAGTEKAFSWVYSIYAQDFAVVFVATGGASTGVTGDVTVCHDRAYGET